MSWLQELTDKLESIEGLPEPIGISINVHSVPREIKIQLAGEFTDFEFIASWFKEHRVRVSGEYLWFTAQAGDGVEVIAVIPLLHGICPDVKSFLASKGWAVGDPDVA